MGVLWSRWIVGNQAVSPEVAATDPVPIQGLAVPALARRRPGRSTEVVRTTLIVLGIAAFAAMLWRLSDIVLLVFIAIIIATVLRGFGELIARLLKVRIAIGTAIATVLVAILIVAFVYFLGQQIAVQAGSLWSELPQSLDNLGARFGAPDLGEQIVTRLEAFMAEPGLIENALGITIGILGWAANLLLALIAGFYLAFRPVAYEMGLLRLIPQPTRQRIGVALDASGRALQLWLIGQSVSMLLVGILTTIGLMILGVESALTLGLLAAILEFIPYVGPWLSAVPAVLIALGADGSQVFWVIGLYVVVQQLEGNIITPLVQQKAVDLPPVLTIFALAAMGTLLGPLGVVLATPITAVAMVFVTQLYLRDTLHQAASLPGEHSRN